MTNLLSIARAPADFAFVVSVHRAHTHTHASPRNVLLLLPPLVAHRSTTHIIWFLLRVFLLASLRSHITRWLLLWQSVGRSMVVYWCFAFVIIIIICCLPGRMGFHEASSNNNMFFVVCEHFSISIQTAFECRYIWLFCLCQVPPLPLVAAAMGASERKHQFRTTAKRRKRIM